MVLYLIQSSVTGLSRNTKLGGNLTNRGVDSECPIYAFKALLLSVWPGHTYLTGGTVCEQKQ